MNESGTLALPGFENFFNRACQSVERSQTFGSIMQSVSGLQRARFRDEFTLTQRTSEATRQLHKYPTRIPLVLEDDPRSPPFRQQDTKRKYLVPRDMSFGEFIHVVRSRAKLRPEQAVFLFIERDRHDGTRSTMLPPTSHTIGALYDSHRDQDLFLYVVCTTENTFG